MNIKPKVSQYKKYFIASIPFAILVGALVGFRIRKLIMDSSSDPTSLAIVIVIGVLLVMTFVYVGSMLLRAQATVAESELRYTGSILKTHIPANDIEAVIFSASHYQAGSDRPLARVFILRKSKRYAQFLSLNSGYFAVDDLRALAVAIANMAGVPFQEMQQSQQAELVAKYPKAVTYIESHVAIVAIAVIAIVAVPIVITGILTNSL